MDGGGQTPPKTLTKIIRQQQVKEGRVGHVFGGASRAAVLIWCQNINFLAGCGFIDKFSASEVA